MIDTLRRKLLHTFYSLSLRTHLLLMTLCLALPAFALIFYSGYLESRDAVNEGIEDGKMIVYTIATEHYNLTGNIEQVLTVLAQVPEIKSRDVAASEKLLGDVLAKNPMFGNIIAAGPDGRVWASAKPRSPFSVDHAKSFRMALKTGRFSTGEFRRGRVSGTPTIGFAYPITRPDGTVSGAILANIDFSHISGDLLRLAGLPPGASITIADCNGTIAARSLAAERFVGTRLPGAVLLGMKNGAPDGHRVDGEGGASIVCYRKLQLKHEPVPYLYIRASIPISETKSKARMALVRNAAFLSPFLLLTLFLVVRIGNASFVRRIGRLESAARRMADGALDERVADVFEGGELGRLARAFDEMAGKLTLRENALTELNLSLARRVEEETELRLRRERLLARHARLAAMGEMIGAIAHQWRQPLATVGVTVQSIRMAWDRGRLDGGFLEKAEADAQKQLYYMSDTIEDFRNFFRPDKVVESFEVRDKVAEVAHLVSARFENAGVQLGVTDATPGAPLSVRGYRNEFIQSLMNLVSNALDAVAQKGAQGAAPGWEGRVVIATSAAGDKAVIEVVDNGCGIPPASADKVFDPYFTTKSSEKGTGIGLYMAKLIIEESMGGRIGFISGADGTIFTVELTRESSEEER